MATTDLFICVTGRTFSGNFLDCWTDFLLSLRAARVSFFVSRAYDPLVYRARNKCLGGEITAGKSQPPLCGINYDKILWIDSDMTWTFDDYARLDGADLPIVSGLYLMDESDKFAAVEKLDLLSITSGSEIEYIPQSIVQDRSTDPIRRVDYHGMGFCLMKEGVLESVGYPWFAPEIFKQGDMVDVLSEDAAFCLRLKERGIDCHVHTGCILGHEKMRVLIP